jgi:hypothetical protein
MTDAKEEAITKIGEMIICKEQTSKDFVHNHMGNDAFRDIELGVEAYFRDPIKQARMELLANNRKK